MGDELDRDVGHGRFEPALGTEPFGKAGTRQQVAQAVSQTASDHDAARPLRKCGIASNRAEAEAETVHRGSSKAVRSIHRRCPDRHVVKLRDSASFYGG